MENNHLFDKMNNFFVENPDLGPKPPNPNTTSEEAKDLLKIIAEATSHLPSSIGRGDLKLKKANIFNALFELSSYIEALNNETESLRALLYKQQGTSSTNNMVVPISTTISKVDDTHPTRSRPKNKIGTEKPSWSEVIIKSNLNKTNTVGELIKINPSVNILRTRQLENGCKVAVSNKEEAEILRQELEKNNFNVRIIKKFLPVLRLTRVPTAYSDEFLMGLFEDSRILRSFGRGPHARDVLMTTNPKKFKEIIKNNGRINFDKWTTIKCYESNEAPICKKCGSLGHRVPRCKATSERCSHCAQLGHSKSDCPSKDSPPKCINCIDKNCQIIDHPTTDRKCPTMLKFMVHRRQNTDYGC
ncbi:hypothetical protein BLOT_007601 [Blomia tropicalis]|nr:hypothetical protein BLOT_007601 [Blomia tropicalis]